jgi:hypothetical protein
MHAVVKADPPPLAPKTNLASVSRTRELAVPVREGLLDWGANGASLAVIRSGGRDRGSNFRWGTKLYEASDFAMGRIRVSRDEKRLAVSGLRYGESFHGEIGIVNLKGKYERARRTRSCMMMRTRSTEIQFRRRLIGLPSPPL